MPSVTAGPTGDYATVQAAIAAYDTQDLTAAGLGESLTITCQNFEDTTQITTAALTGITTDGTYGILVTAANDHGGKWSTSSYRHVMTGVGNGIYIQSQKLANIKFQGLQFEHTDLSTGTYNIMQHTGTGASGHVVEIEKCIFVAPDDADAVKRALHLYENLVEYYVWNSVFYTNGANSASEAILVNNNALNLWLYNCTFDGWPTGIDSTANLNNTIIKNTRITDATTVAAYSIHSDSDYNLTDNSSPPTNWGTNSIDGNDTPTVSYVDDSNATLTSRDYHVQAGDSGIGAGADLSADGDLSFTDDIDGDTRG